MSSCICGAIPLRANARCLHNGHSITRDTPETFGRSALNFEDAFRKACAMELAFKNSEAYQGTTCSTRLVETQEQRGGDALGMTDANHLRAGSVKQLCYFCGNARHPRKIVPLKMPLATFVKRLAIILKCAKNVLDRCCLYCIYTEVSKGRNKLLFPLLRHQTIPGFYAM